MKQLFKSCTAFVLASLLASGATLSVPVQPELAKQIEAAATAARSEGNHAAALREYRRLLELYPNEPGLQAPIYLAMSDTAEKSGDSQQAAQFAAISKALDPALDAQIAQASSAGTQTRGGGDKAGTALAILQAAVNTMATIRATRQAQKQQQLQPPMPPQGYPYPQAQYGQPGYAPPAGNSFAPMPGYADPNAAQAGQYAPPSQYAPPQGQPAYAQPQYAPPQGQPQYAPPQGQPQYAPPQGQPQYAPPQGQPQYAPPQGQPQYAPPQGQPQYAPPQGQPQYAPQGQPMGQPGYYPQPPVDSYRPPQGYQAAGGPTRGEKTAALRVVHDHSRAGDKNYFDIGCGALLSVDGGNLLFTPGGSEAPRLIPTSEISEVRLNVAVGREIGAFHIVTKKGLYLHLAPESGNREDGRAAVDALRKQLGL